MGKGKRGAVLSVLIVAAMALGGGARAQMPAAIGAPGTTLIVTLHAEGAQIYQCKAGADGKLVWTFREPIATLLRDGATVGRHYAGPTWEYADGSIVTGKTAASAAAPGAAGNDVAWLKLDVIGRRGGGLLSDASVVQRINTNGGALAGACETAGALRSVAYSADYVFLRPNR
jgi:hypothetical protein